jgi:hypothetical protein
MKKRYAKIIGNCHYPTSEVKIGDNVKIRSDLLTWAKYWGGFEGVVTGFTATCVKVAVNMETHRPPPGGFGFRPLKGHTANRQFHPWALRLLYRDRNSKKIKVYSIDFKKTWCKLIKAHNKKEAIEIFKKYTNGTHPRFWDSNYTIELLHHPSWYRDTEWLKTTGIYSGEGVKK